MPTASTQVDLLAANTYARASACAEYRATCCCCAQRRYAGGYLAVLLASDRSAWMACTLQAPALEGSRERRNGERDGGATHRTVHSLPPTGSCASDGACHHPEHGSACCSATSPNAEKAHSGFGSEGPRCPLMH